MFPSDNDFDTKVTLEAESIPSRDEDPFRILFLGDWGGKESRLPNSDLFDLQPIEVDRDNFDDVMNKLCAGLDLKFEDGSENIISLNFKELEDFHPDKIFQKVSLFANLRNIRERLMKPATYDNAAKEVRSWLKNEWKPETEITESSNIPLKADQPITDNLLDDILNQNDGSNSKFKTQTIENSELSSLIEKIVKPHLIQTDAVEQSNLLMVVDEVVSDIMRKILHHPQFQALESAWRGLYMLVRKIETDANLKIFLLNITKSELVDNLKSVNNLSESMLYRIIYEEAIEPWSVVCGDYSFNLDVSDVATLIRLAKLSNAANAPFISYIKPQMFGFDNFDMPSASDSWHLSENATLNELWATLRNIPEAGYLGLALPRFVGRLPYGKDTEPTEVFYFEEFMSSTNHKEYLWTNPSFICALLLAQSFQQQGWNRNNALLQSLAGFPLHIYRENDEAKMKACAEIVMTQSNCNQLLEQGLMALISFRNSDSISLSRFQSIAFPSSELNGKWN